LTGGELQRIERVAQIFKDDELARVVCAAKETWPLEATVASVVKELGRAADRAKTRVEANLPRLSFLDLNIETAESYRKLLNVFVDQMEQRLLAIARRIRFQKETFAADLDEFIRATTDMIQLEMQDIVSGKGKDWTNEELWRSFSERQSSDMIRGRFEPVRSRYSALIEQWNEELTLFSQEVSKTATSILDAVDPRVFSGLVSTEHKSAHYMELLGQASSLVAKTTAVAGATVIVTGAANVLAIIAGANPIAIGVGVALFGGLLLFQHFYDPETRKQAMVRDKREFFNQRLREILSEAVPHFNGTLDKIESAFLETANRVYAPLVREFHLGLMQATLQRHVVQRIMDDISVSFRLSLP
jgi:hypothetical protein